jgi:hypothetical protein
MVRKFGDALGRSLRQEGARTRLTRGPFFGVGVQFEDPAPEIGPRAYSRGPNQWIRHRAIVQVRIHGDPFQPTRGPLTNPSQVRPARLTCREAVVTV